MALWHNGESPAFLADAHRELTAPFPINATLIKGVPFQSLLANAVRQEAGFWRASYESILYQEAEPLQESGERATERSRWARSAATSYLKHQHSRADDIESAGHARRERAKPLWKVPSLERIANMYEHFHRSGSPSPTRDVAEALDMPRSTMGKRIMECRRKGLLGPTTRGRAGGLKDEEGKP
jgi:hypothetical protein